MVARTPIRHVVSVGALILTGLLAMDGGGCGPALARSSQVAFAAPSADDHPAIDSLAAPVAVAAHLDRVGPATRLSFDLSKSASARAYPLENPDRIVVETSEIAFQIDPGVGHPRPDTATLVRSFRFGQFAPGKSRIVIDLAGPAKIQKIDVASIAGSDPSRLSILLARCDRIAFRDSIVRAEAEQPPAAPTTIVDLQPVPQGDPRPVIVLDPGHGGIDPGASGLGGVVEKRIVFDFATTLADKLRATGRFKVVLTRGGDAFVSLADRVKIARTAKASLLVSLHADTIAGSGDVTGATVYTVSDRASDAEAARVAESENRADEAAGLDAVPEATDVSDILADLTRRETRTFSHAFQRTLAGYWQKIARLNKNPERSAGFVVLKAPDVPSVLLELGYISSEKDVAALTSVEWRDKAMSSVAASIDAFFASRVPETAGAQVGATAADADRTAVVVLRPHL